MEESPMICARCGGTIHVNEACEDCRISYEEMLDSISHKEMKNLFKKIESKGECCSNVDLEASLMACELAGSSMILPAEIDGDSFGWVELPGPKGKKYIVLCTDMDEYHKAFDEVTPLTNSWRRLLKLLHKDCGGFLINPFGESCYVEMGFIERFFGDE